MPLSATFIGDSKKLQLTFGTEQQTDKAKNAKILTNSARFERQSWERQLELMNGL